MQSEIPQSPFAMVANGTRKILANFRQGGKNNMALNAELLTLNRLGNLLAKLPRARQEFAAQWLLDQAKAGALRASDDQPELPIAVALKAAK
jgi:hypothetical protein